MAIRELELWVIAMTVKAMSAVTDVEIELGRTTTDRTRARYANRRVVRARVEVSEVMVPVSVAIPRRAQLAAAKPEDDRSY